MVKADDPGALTRTVPFTVLAYFEKFIRIEDLLYLVNDEKMVVLIGDALGIPDQSLLSNIASYATLANGDGLPNSIRYLSEIKEFEISTNDANQVDFYDIVVTAEVTDYITYYVSFLVQI